MFSFKNLRFWLLALIGAFSLFTAHSSDLGKILKTAEQVLQNGSGPSENTARSYQGRVISVSDGDTLHVADTNGRKHKIRMAYIDAPESNQAHGKAGRDALRGIVMGKTVAVRVFEADQYGREVAQISLGSRDINLEQIRNGHAWHYVSIAKKKQNRNDFGNYAEAESQARRAGAGLWQQNNPTPPWTFRKNQHGQ